MPHHIHHAGFDLGKDSFMLSHPTDDHARNWPTIEISYKDTDWHEQLLSLLAVDCVCVAEPTGGNLIAPLAAVLQGRARLYLVNHPTTGNIRDENVSRTKSDPMDARALALIATWVDTPAQPLSLRPYSHPDEEATAALRLYLDLYRRLDKQQVATTNRLHALGFAMWPVFSQRLSTWLNAVALDHITPTEVQALAADPPVGVDGRVMRYIDALARDLPNGIHVHPAKRAAVQLLAADLHALESERSHTLSIITDLIEQPPFRDTTAVWRTVPSSSDIALAAFHAATHGRIDTYTADEFKSAIGTNPQGRSSGKSKKSKQSRSGYKPAARQIHLWTLRLIAHKANPVARFFDSTSSPRKLAAARNKFARILWAIATSRQPCNWSQSGNSAGE